MQPAQPELPLSDPTRHEACPVCSAAVEVLNGTCARCRRLVRCARYSFDMGLCPAALRAGGCVGAEACRRAGKRNFFDGIEVRR